MKRILFCIVALVVLVGVIALAPQQTNRDFLRIHIRANSNAQTDQAVKYAVKDAVVNYLAPKLANANTKQKAMLVVEQNVKGITMVCNDTLAQHGFDYSATVSLKKETFPDRSYNGYVLPSGVYDAIIINLGSASGNNWWCVVYPPLCFVGGQSNGTGSINYQSKLWQIVQDWLTKHNN